MRTSGNGPCAEGRSRTWYCRLGFHRPAAPPNRWYQLAISDASSTTKLVCKEESVVSSQLCNIKYQSMRFLLRPVVRTLTLPRAGVKGSAESAGKPAVAALSVAAAHQRPQLVR